jgi:hypothetical protein
MRQWRGLQIADTADGSAEDDGGIVESGATYLLPGGVST